MFTGIVQGLVSVEAFDHEAGLAHLRLAMGELVEGLQTGASVAVNGTCLTATAVDDGFASFDVISQTLQTTNLGELQPGMQVNVERSFRVGDEVGGHILSGHISGTAELVGIETADNVRNLTFRIAAEWRKYLHEKGFVALDGASLTIASLDEEALTVCLIPETIERTTLGRIAEGQRVNLELDAQTQSIVDTVERVLADEGWQRRLRQIA